MLRVFSLPRLCALFGGALLGLPGAPVCAQTYIQTNTTINGSSSITGDIVVGQDSTGTINTNPTVDILPGAMLNYVDGFNSSTVRVGGSSLNVISFHDSSTADVYGGMVNNHIFSYDNSTTNLSGGAVGLNLEGYNQSILNVTGGSIGQFLQTHDHSTLHISGGSVGFDTIFSDDSVATISGGSFNQHNGINFFAENNSALTFVGSNLSFTDLGPFMGAGEEFALGGQLADGTDLTDYRVLEETGFTGSVTLQDTPEPGSMALLTGLSLTGTIFLRRRKQAGKVRRSLA